jgi:arylformamidase
VFPGSPSFSSKELYSLSKGSVYGLCHLSMANHSGTHIDYPGHVIKGGKLSHNFPLNWLIGTGVLVKIPDTEPAITK